MSENLTMKVADQIPFVAVAPDEICRINADGTMTYHWDRIEAAAQRWEPGCADIAVCLAKLLLSLRRRKWRGLSEEERRECTASPFVAENYRAIEAALKERNT
jgi:hypothetical protein